MIVAPQWDRDTQVSNVRANVAAAREIYTLHGAADNLTLLTPFDFNHFSPDRQREMITWIAGQEGAK